MITFCRAIVVPALWAYVSLKGDCKNPAFVEGGAPKGNETFEIPVGKDLDMLQPFYYDSHLDAANSDVGVPTPDPRSENGREPFKVACGLSEPARCCALDMT